MQFKFNKEVKSVIILILINLLIITNFFSQTFKVDSLKKALNVANHDSIKCRVLLQLSEISPDGEWEIFNEKLFLLSSKSITKFKYKATQNNFKRYYSYSLMNKGIILKKNGNIKQSLEYFNQSLKLFNEIKNLPGVAYALGAIAVIYKENGNTKLALEYLLQCEKTQTYINDYSGLAYTCIYLGDIYKILGDIKNSLIFYEKALKFHKKTNTLHGIAFSYNNIALLFYEQKEYNTAFKYYNNALEIQNKIGDKVGAIISYLNIGHLYLKQENFNEAKKYFRKSIYESIKTNNSLSIASSYHSLGILYNKNKELDSAVFYANKALTIFEKVENINGIISNKSLIALILLQQNKVNLSLPIALQSYSLSVKNNYKENISVTSKLLFDIYKIKKDYKNALHFYEINKFYNDSINNIGIKSAIIKSQIKHEYEIKTSTDSIKAAEEKIINALNLKQEKSQKNYLYVGIGIASILTIFIFNRFKLTQKQKKLIEEQKTIVENQKNIVEEKQQEILASIRYAKRIQESLLPTEKYISNKIKS